MQKIDSTVLLIDDQIFIAEAIKLMLAENDIKSEIRNSG